VKNLRNLGLSYILTEPRATIATLSNLLVKRVIMGHLANIQNAFPLYLNSDLKEFNSISCQLFQLSATSNLLPWAAKTFHSSTTLEIKTVVLRSMLSSEKHS
jgi:hypothetical protein